MPTRIFKVSLAENIVRLTVEVNTSESEATLQNIRAVAIPALGLSEDAASRLKLKYADDEGDICTLTSMTLEDLVTLVPEGPIRLTASIEATDRCGTASQPVDEAREEQPSSKEVDEDKNALPADAPGGAEAPPNPMASFIANMAVQHLPMWLPAATTALQDPERQAELNRVGVESREKLLPLCDRLLPKLDMFVENRGFYMYACLKPALEAYIDGSDTQHFGLFLSNLLQSFSGAENDPRLPIVQDIVRDLASSFISMKMAPCSQSFPAPGLSSEGPHGSPSQAMGTPDLGALFGSLFAGKGMGKGMDMPTPSEAGTTGPDLGTLLGGLLGGKGMGKGAGMPTPAQPGTTAPDFSALLGTLLAGKGAGKGMGTPTPSQAGTAGPDLGALLGGLLGGKGMGKGAGMPTPSQAGNTGPDLGSLLGGLFAAKGMGKGAANGADDSVSGQAASGADGCACDAYKVCGCGWRGYGEAGQVAAPVQPVPPNYEEEVQPVLPNYEEEVRDLMDMGLVTDAEVARDLLRSHSGDLASVVAMLTAD